MRNADGSWDAPVAGDHGHLDAVPGADRSGRNDTAEQKPDDAEDEPEADVDANSCRQRVATPTTRTPSPTARAAT